MIENLPFRHRRSRLAAVPTPARVLSLALENIPDGGVRTRVVSVGGDLDMSNAHLLVGFVALAIGHQPTQVVLDLSAVTFFGADGTRALEKADRMVTRTGGRLTIRSMSAGVRFVLAVTGLDTRFAVREAPAPRPPAPASAADSAAGPAAPRRNQRAGGRWRGPRLTCD
ncbi:STAS domain-containing protein [Micromonospora sp. KLBMP9576]|uniref:STAS domain-containing protein n=1 Tax=Micromonospora sp. KLBMP9576 TaxID=3424769 RepID=UPI003D8CEEC6